MSQRQSNQAAPKQKGKLTSELVRQVAEKVITLWRLELAIEQERQRR